MRHHYWEWPIATYLFLGGLGGGIFCLAAIMQFFVFPESANIGEVMALPCFIAIAALGVGCFLLVFELGQPFVFLRVFLNSTSIICWGARILSVCLIFGFVWFVSYLPWEWISGLANMLVPFRGFCLALAGISGACIMLYTGILLSTLKAHSFWATPALPVLFTVSALSTACAAVCLAAGGWPASNVLGAGLEENVATAGEVIHLLHTVDIILVIVEIVVLTVMVLSFLGAGNVTAQKVARRWVKGKLAAAFWGGMVIAGLLLPLIMYAFGSGAASGLVAPVLVLCGGLLLRFLVVYSDDRAPLPGEEKYYTRLPKNDEKFIHAWKYGENQY